MFILGVGEFCSPTIEPYLIGLELGKSQMPQSHPYSSSVTVFDIFPRACYVSSHWIPLYILGNSLKIMYKHNFMEFKYRNFLGLVKFVVKGKQSKIITKTKTNFLFLIKEKLDF